MRSEPATPTRAPDSQFRNMQDSLEYVRHTSKLISGVGVGGGPIPSVAVDIL